MNTKVCICVGLNDKDTKKQETTTAAAVDMVNAAVVRYFGFGTISVVNGVYSHNDSSAVIVVETTIKIELTFFDLDRETTKTKVIPFVQEMKKELNQESIYIDLSTVDAYLI